MDEHASSWTRLSADMNGDGKISVADAGAWLTEILLLPGDACIYLLITYAPGVADFLELGTGSYGGAVAIWASILLWLSAVVVAGTLLDRIRAIDRRATDRLISWYGELQRCVRVARRRIVTMFASRTRGRRADESGLTVDAIRLARLEASVLRCLAGLEDGAVMTLDELAARIECSRRQVKAVLGRLVELEFVEPATDRFTRRNGHRIAMAGQMYLLGA